MQLSSLLWFALLGSVFSWKADYNTEPSGDSATLYEAGKDRVVQLDENTFNDTVFCAGADNCTAWLIEFYADWCGDCRAFTYRDRALAEELHGWEGMVRHGVINCADPFNRYTCKRFGIRKYPDVKYFNYHFDNTSNAAPINLWLEHPPTTIGGLRKDLTARMIDEYNGESHKKWPKLDYLENTTVSELWETVPNDTEHVVIIFEDEEDTHTGAQVILELSSVDFPNGTIRLAKSDNPLVDQLRVSEFPSIVMLARNVTGGAIYSNVRTLMVDALKNFIEIPQVPVKPAEPTNTTADCIQNPEKCKARYYVSELDMLKSLHQATADAIDLDVIAGKNLDNLRNFVALLAEHLPEETADGNKTELVQSKKVKKVYGKLRDFLDGVENKTEGIDFETWHYKFMEIEKEEGYPFPRQVKDWEHCMGSTRRYRGYTCGLWSAFHAVTINAYRTKKGLNASEVLLPIHGYIDSFFTCRSCRSHFLRITGTEFIPISTATKPEDAVVYLWKVHNKANVDIDNKNKLSEFDSEDPLFPKYQFPAPFLCPTCHSNDGSLNETAVLPFLTDYYSHIKPYERKKVSSQ